MFGVGSQKNVLRTTLSDAIAGITTQNLNVLITRFDVAFTAELTAIEYPQKSLPRRILVDCAEKVTTVSALT